MQGSVRIIGGVWRGRKLKVAHVPGLRPTPDRVRETLFNWLAPVIAGARCLDLFAGSGVLGFEALSRGAQYVEMIEADRRVIQLLKEEVIQFKTTAIALYQARVPEGLLKPAQPFDLVFLDPPYQSQLLFPTCFYLENHHYLGRGAYIYLEADRAVHEQELPANWRIIKSQRAGLVFYHLAQRVSDV
jgi:16S rRNA (guanine966-N2)-methyltransferase